MPKRLHTKKLVEISLVPQGANQHADIEIAKAADDATVIAKYLNEVDRPLMVAEVLADEEKQRRFWQNVEAVEPLLHAYSQSLRSIFGAEPPLDPSTRLALVQANTQDFLARTGASDGLAKCILETAEGEQVSTTDAAVATLAARLAKADIEGDEGMADDRTKELDELRKAKDELTEKVSAMEKAQAETQAKLAEAEAMAKMSDDEKACAAKMGEKERAEFMAMSPEARREHMKMQKAADETIEVDGALVRKSVVGEEQFNFMKRLVARDAEREEAMRKATEKAEAAEFAKQADGEFAKVAGTTDEKVALLRHMAKADDGVRETFGKILRANVRMVEAGFKEFGKRADEDAGSAEERLDKAVAAYRKDHPDVTEATAYAKVMEANPGLYQPGAAAPADD